MQALKRSASETIRVLLVCRPGEERKALEESAGQSPRVEVHWAPALEGAIEVLLRDSFDVLLLNDRLPAAEESELRSLLRTMGDSTAAGVSLVYASQLLDGSLSDLNSLSAADAEPALLPAAVTFDPDAFGDQCLHEPSIMLEIIELFLAEKDAMFFGLTADLAACDFTSLERSAHSLKGSLAALHALVAHELSGRLELAAKDGRVELCSEILATLTPEVERLAARLSEFRLACLAA